MKKFVNLVKLLTLRKQDVKIMVENMEYISYCNKIRYNLQFPFFKNYLL